MKRVVKHLEETNPERVPIFKAKAQEKVKLILGMIKDLQFYVGESMDAEGTVLFCNYREDG
eukprot:Pgem_evm1s8579